MQAFGVLDRYIGKTIFNTIMMTLFMLVSLSGIIKFVDQLKKSGQGSYDALGAGLYTILSVPKDIQIFFPMAALLGALLGLGMLAQRSELVVMQASGFTRLQVALAVMKTAIPLVLLTMAIGEWVAPQGEQIARNYRAQQMYGGSLLSTQQGLWAKDGHNFVYIERVKGNDELGGVSIYAFNPERRLQSVRYAASAKFDSENKVWRLSQVDESDLTDPKQVTGSQMVSGTWKTNLTPDKLGVVALDPDALSISGLHNYVKYLKSSGQDPGRYQLNMWSKIFQPLSVAVMKTAIPLVLLTMAIGEWVAPQGEQMARNYRAQQMYGGSLLSTQQGLWAKDGHNFVYIERVKGNDELGGVSIYAFNPERRLQSVRYAASAKFDSENKVWRRSQVDVSDLTDPKQVTGSQMVSGTWKTNLTPDKLGVVALDPDALSISGLHNYVKYLKSSGQDPGRYQLNMWSKIFQPLSVAVMMLMALSFIFGPLRSVPMGVRVVTGISFGFIFYVLDQIFGPLTLVYGIPPIIGALLPSASFFLISLWLMMRKA